MVYYEYDLSNSTNSSHAAEEPSVPFTPGLPRTIHLAVDYAQVGLEPGCWHFVPLFLHDGTVPAAARLSASETAQPMDTLHDGPLGTTAMFELTVGPRGMGVWELQACVDYAQ